MASTLGPLTTNQNIPLATPGTSNGAISSNGAEIILNPGKYEISYSASGSLSVPVELRVNTVPIPNTTIISNAGTTASNTIIFTVTAINTVIGMYFIGSGTTNLVFNATISAARIN
ncbi:hypothetical protein ACFSTH_03185 [Paenibacillus yanchengensis]|uniref:hypothetical protein n=1 Tax=Paenibacillus yanchengensis TaxID=2035833 RepID=UPI00362CBD7B